MRFSKKMVGLIFVIMMSVVNIYARVAKKTSAAKKPIRKTTSQKISSKNVAAYPANIINNEFVTLLNSSSIFDTTVGKFPTNNNRIALIAGNNEQLREKIVAQAKATYPLLHQNTRSFLDRFLQYKKQNGTNQEKALYATMNVPQFLMRLIEQRPLMFMMANDRYLLRSNGISGSGGFETIGTANERSPLLLKDYLSYDEMAVAALIGISSPTYFINDGARDNRAVPGDNDSFEREGVYVGLVGARFEKPNYMEWQHMIITPEQNRQENGYGLTSSNQGLLGLWANLYGEKFPTFAEAQSDRSGKYVLLDDGSYFNTLIYKKRIRLVVEPFLVDASKRALLQGKTAYVHVVGLGLGVWQIDKRQASLMVDVYTQVLKENDLSGINDIDFSWFGEVASESKDAIIQEGTRAGITMYFSKRNPADKLMGAHADTLLVAMYAWDGNAYPGNEYWAGMLTASGDPAAACCSTIAELQNPKINHYIKNNIAQMFGVKITSQNVPQQKPVAAPSAAATKRKGVAAKRTSRTTTQRKTPTRKIRR